MKIMESALRKSIRCHALFFQFSKILKYSNFQFSMKLNLNEYLKEINNALTHISDNVDALDSDAVECNYDGSGVLKFQITNEKKYVLNIQRPTQQLWVSSPVSGPYKFEFEIEKKCWIDVKNNLELYELLNKEINELFKQYNINSNINIL